MQRKNRICVWAICMLLLFAAVTGCSRGSVPAGPVEEKVGPLALALDFASYKEVPASFSPAVGNYVVEPGLGNVSNREMFSFSPEAERLLVENGFVVIPGPHREFFMLYEINRYEPVPNFITTDSMLHNYHLFFSHLLRVTEKEKLAPQLKELTADMLLASERQYASLRGSGWEDAAKRNLGFFAVAGRLLDPKMPVPSQVKSEVEKELAFIESRAGIQVSPLMSMGQDLDDIEALQEDYSQYIPRGHYDNSELLQSYFKAMMWYGRMTFRLKSEDETKSAVLITLALSEGENGQKWDKIYQPTNFFVGKSDDLSFLNYREVLDKTYGNSYSLKDVISGGEKWEAFKAAAAKLEPPAINSIPVYDEDIQPDREREI